MTHYFTDFMSYSTRTVSPFTSAKRTIAEPTLRLVCFNIGTLDLALPIHVVYKVVPCDVVYGTGRYPAGITIVGDQEYTVIDLEERLFGNTLIHRNSDSIEPTGNKPLSYLLLVQFNQGERIGIPVSHPPSLVEASLGNIRLLPLSYRKVDTLSIASHLVKIEENDRVKMIFILDTNSLLPA